MNKEKIAVLTDSCADIPETLIKKHDLHILPLKIIFSGKAYTDGVDITAAQVYDKLPCIPDDIMGMSLFSHGNGHLRRIGTNGARPCHRDDIGRLPGTCAADHDRGHGIQHIARLPVFF